MMVSSFVIVVSTPENTYRMCMVTDVLLHRSRPHPRNVDIPAIYKMSIWRVQLQPILVRTSVDDFHLREADSLFVARSSRYAGNHHKLDQLLCL